MKTKNAHGTKAEDVATSADEVLRRRRDFLRAAGLGGAALALAACGHDVMSARTTAMNFPPTDDNSNAAPGTVVLDFKNDFGVLNYAYALEQLEAAFYVAVLTHPYAGMSAQERRVLTDVRDHEIAHRDFFKAALGANAVGSLTPDFHTIDFGSRSSVLQTARTFEDLGVAAYNGAGKYLTTAAYLTIAGKIVSVEARHASVIRDLLAPKSSGFAPKAFDDAFEPPAVLTAADPFISTPVQLINYTKQ